MFKFSNWLIKRSILKNIESNKKDKNKITFTILDFSAILKESENNALVGFSIFLLSLMFASCIALVCLNYWSTAFKMYSNLLLGFDVGITLIGWGLSRSTLFVLKNFKKEHKESTNIDFVKLQQDVIEEYAKKHPEKNVTIINRSKEKLMQDEILNFSFSVKEKSIKPEKESVELIKNTKENQNIETK